MISSIEIAFTSAANSCRSLALLIRYGAFSVLLGVISGCSGSSGLFFSSSGVILVLYSVRSRGSQLGVRSSRNVSSIYIGAVDNFIAIILQLDLVAHIYEKFY